MGIKQYTNTGIGLGNKLSPQAYDSLKILQMSQPEIAEIVKEELQKNPFIERNNNLDFFFSPTSEEDASVWAEDKLSPIEDIILDIKREPLAGRDRDIACDIINNLDENGLFIKNDTSFSDKDVNRVLEDIIFKIAPKGIGARSQEESIVLQLTNPETKEIFQYLNAQTKISIEDIHDKLGYSEITIQESLEEIGRASPSPGRNLNHKNIEYDMPDIRVFYDEDCLKAEVVENEWSGIRLVSFPDIELNDELTKYTERAKNLIEALEHRNNTLSRIAVVLLEQQPDFFKSGEEFLKPLSMKQIADKLELHESTISRAVSCKNIETPHGKYKIKDIFVQCIKMRGGGKTTSFKIKKRIDRIIKKEDTSKPESDNAITDKLNKEGYIIARRTISKYRDELKIAPAKERKKK